ncbi:MAG: hypothetical protein ACLRR6_05140 [Oscillospiraceae bacterium]
MEKEEICSPIIKEAIAATAVRLGKNGNGYDLFCAGGIRLRGLAQSVYFLALGEHPEDFLWDCSLSKSYLKVFAKKNLAGMILF